MIPLPYQFYGRIRRMEIACPNCGIFYTLSPGCKNWNHHTGRFRCSSCFKYYDLGVLAWPARANVKELPPLDTLRKPPAVSKLSPGFTAALHSRIIGLLRRSGDPVNQVVEEGTPGEPRRRWTEKEEPKEEEGP